MTLPMQNERPATAAEVCRRFELGEVAASVLRAEHTPQQYFAELAKARLYDDAVRFAAHYFTPREAVWWGALCLWQVFRQQPPDAELAVLKCVLDWLRRPEDAQRRCLESAMRSADVSLLSTNLAVAVFCSGGSISLADQPNVPPPASQTANSVAAVVCMASRRVPPALHHDCMHHFLKLASEVSRGETPWPSEPLSEPMAAAPEHHHAH